MNLQPLLLRVPAKNWLFSCRSARIPQATMAGKYASFNRLHTNLYTDSFTKCSTPVLHLYDDSVQQPRLPPLSAAPRLLLPRAYAQNPDYSLYFDDCVGDLDGTHITLCMSRNLGRDGRYAAWESQLHDFRMAISALVFVLVDYNFRKCGNGILAPWLPQTCSKVQWVVIAQIQLVFSSY